MQLDYVSSNSVCGVTSTGARTCVGNSGPSAVNDTVSQLKYFILGAGQLCGVDERGVRCWFSNGKYEKPIQTILSEGDNQRVRIEADTICLPHADNTIHCYRSEESNWVTGPDGQSHEIRRIPPVQVFGPFSRLQDFQFNSTALCALNNDEVICAKFNVPKSQEVDLDFEVPKNKFPGARGLNLSSGTICVLYQEGLDCTRGTPRLGGLTTYQLRGTWTKAVKLFRNGFDTLCAVDADEQPMCAKLGAQSDEVIDKLPNELSQPDIRILKFKAAGDTKCALVEEKGQRELLCGTFGPMTAIKGYEDIENFDVSYSSICAVRPSNGQVDCFYNNARMPSPLPEDGSASFQVGACRWNDSRFHCAPTEMTEKFDDIRKVVAVTPPSDELVAPCLIYENSGGIRQVKCLSGARDIIDAAVNVDPMASSKIAASYNYACVYGSENISCWGKPIAGLQPPNLTGATKVLLGGEIGCGIDQFGFVCWGELEKNDLMIPPGLGDLNAVSDFAIGFRHVCAITNEKQVVCWGKNEDGQTEVPALTNPTSLAAYGNVTCASSDEGVTCWGDRRGPLAAPPDHVASDRP